MRRLITWIRKHGGTIVSVVALLALAVCGVYYRREIWDILVSQEARDAFIAYVRESGLVGLALFFGLQILQVVVAVLPGEPVELMAGLLYGTWGGLMVCLVGVALSTLIVYYCVRAAGAKAIDPSTLKKYRFLRDEAHVKLFLFVLFFIPGTPKDVLIYLGPFLPVKPFHFLLLATIGRIPSILTSTFSGRQFAVGSWQVSLVVIIVTGVLAGLCLLFQERILSLLASWRERFAKKENGGQA